VYVKPEQLNEAVTASQKAGRVTDEFACILMKIVRGVCQEYRTDPSDIHGETFLCVARNLDRIDTSQNVFNFLTATVVNAIRNLRRMDRTQENLAKELGRRMSPP
jgi:DNA-directed RNA polymerase specialized sigma24 family protein